MELAKRKNIRLSNYDYSQNGAYFVTICTYNRECLLGEIVGNGLDRSVLKPTDLAIVAERELKNVPQHFDGVLIDKYVIMPNHIHLILFINREIQAERSRPFPTLSTIIGLFKSGVSRKIGFSIWQKSFHDHIIRNEQKYQKIWNYIDTNPQKWEEDILYTKQP